MHPFITFLVKVVLYLTYLICSNAFRDIKVCLISGGSLVRTVLPQGTGYTTKFFRLYEKNANCARKNENNACGKAEMKIYFASGQNSPSWWALLVNSFMPFAVYHAPLTTPLTACKNRLITQTIADTFNFRPTVTKRVTSLKINCRVASVFKTCDSESESGRANLNNGIPCQDKASSQSQVACTFCTQLWCSYSPCQHRCYRVFNILAYLFSNHPSIYPSFFYSLNPV